MNKKLKKMLATVSAMVMCAVSVVSVSAGALYTPTNKEVRPETTSFSATIYDKTIKFNLWQEATDYFGDEDIKMYISDKLVNDYGKEYIYTAISVHQVYRNTPDGPLHDDCTVGCNGWFDGDFLFDQDEDDVVNFEKYLSDNNIPYEKSERRKGTVAISIQTCIKISDDEIEPIYTNEEYFEILQKIKEDTGLICEYIYPESTVEIESSENALPEPTLTGDANEDGEVKLSDAVLIMQALSNPDEYQLTPQGIANADMDGDGITPMDALRIQEIALDK